MPEQHLRGARGRRGAVEVVSCSVRLTVGSRASVPPKLAERPFQARMIRLDPALAPGISTGVRFFAGWVPSPGHSADSVVVVQFVAADIGQLIAVDALIQIHVDLEVGVGLVDEVALVDERLLGTTPQCSGANISVHCSALFSQPENCGAGPLKVRGLPRILDGAVRRERGKGASASNAVVYLGGGLRPAP